MHHTKATMVIQRLFCLLAVSPLFANAGMKFIVIGDWGEDSAEQYAVADAMSSWCSPGSRGPCEFIVNTGDNFYPEGVLSVDDPRFNTTWKWVYDLPHINQLVWAQSLGNHDYFRDDRELYQVDYGKIDSQWYLPWLWYDFYRLGADDALVQFIAVDTTAMIERKHDGMDGQLAWLENVLATSTADWKIMFGHHPPFSVGSTAPGTETMREFLVPLCNQYGVDIFFNGHEHNLQHITSANVTDYVVSGAGGKALSDWSPGWEEIIEGLGITVEYFGYHFGFVTMDITKTSYTAEFVDETLAVRHSYSRTK